VDVQIVADSRMLQVTIKQNL